MDDGKTVPSRHLPKLLSILENSKLDLDDLAQDLVTKMGEGDEAAVKLEGKEEDVVIEFVGGGGNEDVLKGLKAGDKVLAVEAALRGGEGG